MWTQEQYYFDEYIFEYFKSYFEVENNLEY